MGALFKGAIPGDPIGSKMAEKVDPLYDKHQAVMAFNQDDVRRKQAAALAPKQSTQPTVSSGLASNTLLNN